MNKTVWIALRYDGNYLFGSSVAPTAIDLKTWKQNDTRVFKVSFFVPQREPQVASIEEV